MNKLISISSRLPLALGLLFISSAPLTIAQTPSAPSIPSQQIWGCRTENGTRIYVVDQLRRNEDNFDVAIYERTGGSGDRSGIEEKYIGTAQVKVSQKEPELIGSGQTFNSTFRVEAFGRTVAFSVQDSVAGSANGRCNVQWQMADRETRRLVRQCLALAAGGDGNVASVEQFGCTTDPKSYIEELQGRR